MTDDADPAEYDIRHEGEGWTVYNVLTLEPARLNGVAQVGLRMEAAVHVADLLTSLESEATD